MRIYIMADFEGACAVVGEPGVPLTAGSGQYEFARRMVTAEINAAVEGALAGGATDVIVNDAHGGALNLPYDDLHPAVRIVVGPSQPRRLPGLEPGSAGMFLIAYHAMAGTENGVLAHSYSSVSVQNMWLNDALVGEIAFDAALAGCLGVPVLLVTSDVAGTAEATAALGPRVRTVAVKEGLGRNGAISLHPRRAQELIRAAAEDAVRHSEDGVPYVVQPPYRVRREYKFESQAEQAVKNRIDATKLDCRTVETASDDLFALI
ncbi:MAG: M55 family metallopeptidase [Anaerolineae bacterium]